MTLRKLLVTLAALVGIIATAAPAQAVYVDTQVINRWGHGFTVENNGATGVIYPGQTSYTKLRWLDVDSLTFWAGECGELSVNGGPWFRKGPGVYRFPDAVRSIAVHTWLC